ncbi:hypothetical protein MYX82_03800 [Acidobacteria bacterium AH-259-D05]|nr:hypothetical protein [Acidobacteria bacterium AH-259-D05]
MTVKKVVVFTSEELKKIILVCRCGTRIEAQHTASIRQCPSCETKFADGASHALAAFEQFHNNADKSEHTFEFSVEINE